MLVAGVAPPVVVAGASGRFGHNLVLLGPAVADTPASAADGHGLAVAHTGASVVELGLGAGWEEKTKALAMGGFVFAQRDQTRFLGLGEQKRGGGGGTNLRARPAMRAVVLNFILTGALRKRD